MLVIAHPSDPRWERTTGTGSPRLSFEELDAIEEFVAAGGGLVVLGETEQEKYGNNLNELLARFGLHLENDTVQDYENCRDAPSWILADLAEGERGRAGDVLARVKAACLYRATTISSSNGAAVLARTHATASAPNRPLIVAARHGQGRVVVLADSDLFGDDCIDDLDHRTLWLNILYWVSRSDGGVWPVAERQPGVEREPAWLALRDETNALAELQAPDGSLDRAIPEVARAHVERMIAAIEELAAALPARRRVPGRRGRGPARVGGGGIRQARLHQGARAVPPRAASGATESSTWSCSRCTSRTARGTPASRR